jgi:hypothetical protein
VIRLETFLLRTVATAALAGVALLVFPHDRTLVVRVSLLVVGGLALAALVRGASDLTPTRAARRRPPKSSPHKPDELRRLEDQTALACVTAGDLHVGLRPVLREIAVERLGREPDEATAGAAWALLRPDLAAPRDPFARGLTPAQLSQVVDAIERL